MGYINQALVQDPLIAGGERIPVIVLVIVSLTGIVIDFDFGIIDAIYGLAFLAWGMYVLRRCGSHDPRLFQNLIPKCVEFAWYWCIRPSSQLGRWGLPACPSYMPRRSNSFYSRNAKLRGNPNDE